MADYISREAIHKANQVEWHGLYGFVDCNIGVYGFTDCDIFEDNENMIDRVPAADVVPAEAYNHLLKIASKMHLWIFMNTGDEQAAYDECGLTDEDNAMLGYGGQYILSTGEEDESVQ